MRCPQDHEKYYTEAQAANALRQVTAQAKRTGLGGKSYKRLNVFACGNHWHVGRANQFPKSKPAPQVAKPAPVGELRRKLERMARVWERREDHERRQRAEALGRLIAAERAMVDAQNEYAEQARQVTAMFLPETR